MKNRFESIRIYDDENGFHEPYSNIEFVVTGNVVKGFINAWTPLKQHEWVSDSKYIDRRMVYRPQNYEQFLKYLSETKVNDVFGDIRVFYSKPNSESEINGLVDLEYEGYETLLALATEMLYIENDSRSEKTENHIKRTFVNRANKIHKDMTAKYQRVNNEPKGLES